MEASAVGSEDLEQSAPRLEVASSFGSRSWVARHARRRTGGILGSDQLAELGEIMRAEAKRHGMAALPV